MNVISPAPLRVRADFAGASVLAEASRWFGRCEERPSAESMMLRAIPVFLDFFAMAMGVNHREDEDGGDPN